MRGGRESQSLVSPAFSPAFTLYRIFFSQMPFLKRHLSCVVVAPTLAVPGFFLQDRHKCDEIDGAADMKFPEI